MLPVGVTSRRAMAGRSQRRSPRGPLAAQDARLPGGGRARETCCARRTSAGAAHTRALAAEPPPGRRDLRARHEQYNLSLIHISEPTRLGMISYAVFCLKKK